MPISPSENQNNLYQSFNNNNNNKYTITLCGEMACFYNFKADVTYSRPSALKVNHLPHTKCSESFTVRTKMYINAIRTTYIPYSYRLFRTHTNSSGTPLRQLTEGPHCNPQ